MQKIVLFPFNNLICTSCCRIERGGGAAFCLDPLRHTPTPYKFVLQQPPPPAFCLYPLQHNPPFKFCLYPCTMSSSTLWNTPTPHFVFTLSGIPSIPHPSKLFLQHPPSPTFCLPSRGHTPCPPLDFFATSPPPHFVFTLWHTPPPPPSIFFSQQPPPFPCLFSSLPSQAYPPPLNFFSQRPTPPHCLLYHLRHTPPPPPPPSNLVVLGHFRRNIFQADPGIETCSLLGRSELGGTIPRVCYFSPATGFEPCKMKKSLQIPAQTRHNTLTAPNSVLLLNGQMKNVFDPGIEPRTLRSHSECGCCELAEPIPKSITVKHVPAMGFFHRSSKILKHIFIMCQGLKSCECLCQTLLPSLIHFSSKFLVMRAIALTNVPNVHYLSKCTSRRVQNHDLCQVSYTCVHACKDVRGVWKTS